MFSGRNWKTESDRLLNGSHRRSGNGTFSPPNQESTPHSESVNSNGSRVRDNQSSDKLDTKENGHTTSSDTRLSEIEKDKYLKKEEWL